MAGEMERRPKPWVSAAFWFLFGRSKRDPADGIRGPYGQAFNVVMFLINFINESYQESVIQAYPGGKRVTILE
jgi:hypothetical protein